MTKMNNHVSSMWINFILYLLLFSLDLPFLRSGSDTTKYTIFQTNVFLRNKLISLTLWHNGSLWCKRQNVVRLIVMHLDLVQLKQFLPSPYSTKTINIVKFFWIVDFVTWCHTVRRHWVTISSQTEEVPVGWVRWHRVRRSGLRVNGLYDSQSFLSCRK